MILFFSFNALDFFILNTWPIHGQGAAQYQFSERPFHSVLHGLLYFIFSQILLNVLAGTW